MSSSISTYTTSSGSTAISGLISGLDTASLVDELVDAESTKLDSLNQKVQSAEWKQEAYREIITELQDFTDTYFSSTSSSSLVKQANYLQYDVTSSNASAVTATAGVDSVIGTHTLTISQVATAATLSSSSEISSAVAGSCSPDFAGAVGQSFVLTVDGTDYEVSIDSSITDVDSLQEAVDTAVGGGKITVDTDSGGALTFSATADSGVTAISITDSDSDGALTKLGFDDESTTSNRIDTSSTLAEISAQMDTAMTFDDDGNVTFSINGTSFTFSEDTTLEDVTSEVNESACGATLAYNELTDTLTLTSDATGAGKLLTAGDTGGTFISSLLGTATEGTDAIITYDGAKLTRSSNDIDIDGVSYTIVAETTEAVTVDVAQNSDAIYDLVSNFVEAYNSLIETINEKLDEEYDSDYQPLTEDEEAEMSETEIENWNKKAQTGLLEDDSLLSDLLSELRVAMMDSVSGSSLTLSAIGITSGTYDEEGQLYIDEDTLLASIEEDAGGVAALFAQKSTTYSANAGVRTMTADEREIKYNEEGIAQRFADLLSDYVSTSTDSAGNKGRLLEAAGIDSDGSDTDNALTAQIEEYEERIEKEEERLKTLRELWESKFSAMEAALAELSSQSSYIDSLMGTDE
ncbi:MAG: flagellar filament capping protein FliD [Negativicutes bacterium]